MTTISVINRFLRLTAQETLESFNRCFITIDHGVRASQKQTNIELAKNVLNMPPKTTSSQTITIKRASVEEFNRAILKLHTAVEKACSTSYDVSNAAKLCLDDKSSAYDTCCKVISAIEAEAKNKAKSDYASSVTNAARDMMLYMENSFVKHVKEYYNEIKSGNVMNETFYYKDSVKNFTVANYVAEINKLKDDLYFGGSPCTTNSNRYEFVMMIDNDGLGEICLAWCKQYKIELQVSARELGSMIDEVMQDCFSSGYFNKDMLGYHLHNKYLPNGHDANEDSLRTCCIVILSYDTSRKQLYFKCVPSS